MSESSSAPASVPEQLRRVTLHAVASGLTPLIPVPFLDEYALRRVRERMVRDLLRERNLSAPDRVVTALAGLHRPKGSRIQGMIGKTALLSLRLAWKKFYRRLALALWMKDCVDMASTSLHHGYLLQHALGRGDLDARSLQVQATALRVHAAIDAACAEQDPRPINQLLRRLFSTSKLLLSELSRALDNSLSGAPRVPEPGEDQEVASLTDRLAAELWEERGYFQALVERYEKHFQQQG
jgi:hypothetical protein